MSDSSRTYTVGWICALSVEFGASQAFLDGEHAPPQTKAQHDDNAYVLGSIAGHNVVMAVLPAGEYGTASAAGVAKDMLRTFPDIRFGLMVGIGGGAPSPKHDVRLGDVVVSRPGPSHGGVVQYDFGKRIQGQDFQQTGFLSPPPRVLLTALQLLETKHERERNGLETRTKEVFAKYPKLRKKYSRPSPDSDRLYDSEVIHPKDAPNDRLCAQVCAKGLVKRAARDEDEDPSSIHYGLIASGNSLMKDAKNRNMFAETEGVLCFEMEAAGLMNTNFKCLVIRGICDYSDTHKNEDWQGYASLVAAAYAADLLRRIPPSQIQAERKMDVNGILQGIEQKVDDIRQSTLAINTTLESDKIRRWLSPPDPSTNANHARKERREGTGIWLLKSPAFQEWQSGSRRHLWLHGLVGCGKTVLTTTVFDHLEKGSDLILSFFFDFSDAIKQTVDGMLRSLTFQLYRRGLDSTQLNSLFQSHQDGRNQPTTKTLREAVYKLLRRKEKAFIIIDALDESTTRTELLDWIREVTSATELNHIQLVCVSRPEAEFAREIPLLIGEKNCLGLDKGAINADIHSYVTERLEKSREFAKWASYPTVLREIREKIGRKSDGMFRWAACQLDSLQACLDREEVETALQTLPRDLNETYTRMLKRIPPERKHKAIRLLQFLIHSERLLTLKEAVDVLAVRLDDCHAKFDEDDRMPNPREITAFCPSLVSVVQVRQSRYSQEPVEELHLAHLSVKEYLLAGKVDGFLDAEASICITQTCLVYLSSITMIQERPVSHFALAKHAAKIWMDHAKSADGDKLTGKRVLRFLRNRRLLQAWTKLYQPDKPWTNEPDDTEASCLYFTCFKGLVKTTKQLIEQCMDVNAQGGEYGNALQAASVEGQTEIVRLLLDEGADINAQGGYYGNALQAASVEGKTEIVRLLLDKGADVNAQGGEYGNALQAASVEGQTEIVRLLLDEGADVNAQGGRYGNALQAASVEGQTEIVQLLLDKGVDVNAQGGRYGKALQAASYGGQTEIVRLLLDKGADINGQGGFFGNAFQAASYGGHTEIVRLLLDKGADVNTQGGEFGNAFQAASVGGKTEIMRLLLDEGADINAQGGEYGNALQAASVVGGKTEIVRLLLDKGANINAQGGRYGNALHTASVEGKAEIVRLLLDKGADVNVQGGRYGNALQAASVGGKTEIVRLLLDKGADVNAQGGEYGNALQAAFIVGGKTEITRLLLDKGADVNVQGGRYGNALHATSVGGKTEVARLLQERAANQLSRKRGARDSPTSTNMAKKPRPLSPETADHSV